MRLAPVMWLEYVPNEALDILGPNLNADATGGLSQVGKATPAHA